MPLPKPESGSAAANFIKLNDGANRVRIVSEPVDTWEHFVTNTEGKKSPKECAGRECTICMMEEKASHRYHFAALNIGESDLTVRLLTVGQTVYSQYYDLSQTSDWAFDMVPDFDLVITKRGQGMETEYSVAPVPKRALTAEQANAVSAGKKVGEMLLVRYGK